MSSKNSHLVVSEILRVFVNILAPDNKYSLSIKANVQRNQFKCNYLKTKKYFRNIFLHFRNLHKLWNTFRKKMSLLSYLFLKLYTAKCRVTEMPKKPCVRALIDSQHVEVSERLLKSPR